MDTALLNSKMNEYMFRLNQKMGAWLAKKLPKITDNWWQELVINNLSSLQKDKVLKEGIKSIDGLDLAALLRIVDRNWFAITSQFYINNKERYKIRDMQQIRNDWAHITPSDITKEKVINDANIIIELMQAFDASMKETRDMESFVLDVEDDKDIHIEAQKSVEKKLVDETSPISAAENTEIALGSVVTLVSDPKTVGDRKSVV